MASSNYVQSSVQIDNVISNPLSVTTIKEGWCLKQAYQTYNKWEKIYIQLSMEKQLNYYIDESMIHKKGTIFLNDLTSNHIKRSSKVSDSKHHGFCVITTKQTYQFCVISSSDCDDWIQKIRQVVQHSNDDNKDDFILIASHKNDGISGGSNRSNTNNQLLNLDNIVHKTNHILNGMKHFSGMFSKKIKKNSSINPLQCNKYNNNSQIQQHDGTEYDTKLDELLKGIRELKNIQQDINNAINDQDADIDGINDKMDNIALPLNIQRQNTTVKAIGVDAGSPDKRKRNETQQIGSGLTNIK